MPQQTKISKQNISPMSKKKFRIGELAKELQVKKFVIRFWEKEFELKSDRSQGGQRYYTHEDFKAFNTIKYLLYKQGFTIAGAKTQLEKILKEKTNSSKQSIIENKQKKPIENKQIQAATKTIEKPVPYIPKEFLEKVVTLKKKLIQLKQSLD